MQCIHSDQEDKVLSWWDYGYQLTGMGNKTVIVDNNTRNNTHIATVGLTMASTEEKAYPILRRLDVKYVVVVFGGLIGYSSDDINKFLWMVRISGGVFPRIIESNYYNNRGMYTVDQSVSDVMKHSLMYKMCYYRFQDVTQGGMDRTRGNTIHVEVCGARIFEFGSCFFFCSHCFLFLVIRRGYWTQELQNEIFRRSIYNRALDG